MSLTESVRATRLPRLALGVAMIALTLAASGCVGRGDAFAGPDCEEPVVPPAADSVVDSTRADPPVQPTPDKDVCSAPNV